MIKFFNTLGHKKEEFKPQKDKLVRFYVCGPTVYDYDHLGHARTSIIFDTLRRFLLSEDYRIKFLQNITDVGHLTDDSDLGEDKIEKKAKVEKKDPKTIASFYEKAHFEDMKALNVLPPDISARATEHIKEIVDFIQDLIKKNHAYEVSGNVYFDISSFPKYGKLSNRRVDELIAGGRVKVDPKKKNPADFALWKKADKNHIMQWDSPWGKGYPGWHIECSAIAQKYLGPTLDIHSGANDLIFPHHEDEIAQSESRTGKPFARYWLHSGMLTIKGGKMSKSAGNFITIRDLLKKYDADTTRIAFLRTHWRKPLDWLAPRSPKGEVGEEKSFEEAKLLARRLDRARGEAQKIKTGYKTAIAEALSDDLNTPKALGIIFDDLTKLSQDDFDYIEKVFGLKMKKEVKLTLKQEKMIKEREKARENGDFKKADKIRETLEKEGIIVEDTTEGTRVLTF